MLFVTLLDLLYLIFDTLLGWINVPAMPDDINSVYEFINLAINNGASLVCFFFNVTVLKFCLTLVLAFHAFEFLYWVVMWFLKKIPMAGMQ